jgi:hypothetical protein
MQKKNQEKNWKYSQRQYYIESWLLAPGNGAIKRGLLTVNSCIKVHLDLQADKSSVVVKGPFSPQVWTHGIESVEQCVTEDPI